MFGLGIRGVDGRIGGEWPVTHWEEGCREEENRKLQDAAGLGTVGSQVETQYRQ